ncbi:MAG TPA: hypothetical protein PLO43_01590, partial [Chlamydiales bacterium]|nr:hypothetical protein [Chlamydiales bacterium]
MVSEVKDIKPHDWKEIDLELIPRSYPFQIPQSLKNNRHLISQALAACYQFGNRSVYDFATLNFSVLNITPNSLLPFLAAAGVNYGIPKAIETAKAWWSGKPSPDLVHTHNCIQQMLMPDFNEYGKAKVFLAAMSQNPKLFWTAQESKSLQGLVQAIPSDENPEKTKCDEVAKKAFKLVHQKYCSQQGWYTKITEGVPQISLDAIYAPFKKMFSLLGESEKGIGNFLRPFLEGFLRKTLDTLKISGSTYLPDTVERSDYEKHCDAVISMVGKVPYGQVLSGVLDHLFGQRYALAFGFKVPWVEPRVETSELPQPQRKKTVVPENPQTVDELIAETKQLQEQCVEKGSLFFWYWIFVHIIGSRDDVDITPCIKKVFASKEKGKDPLEEFYNAVIKQLDTSKTATWRRMLVKFIWNCTPLYSLSKFMMKRSIHAVEQWFEELRKRKESNEYDISEAKVIEAILKQWIGANKKINDQKAYEDEISEILLEGEQRKILINKLTNVLVDRCFPDIDFMGWCEDCDKNIANYHDQCHAVLAPFVWLGSYPVRGALLLLKFALLASQRVLNFLGRFGTKLIIKRFGVMQKVFDFRLRLQKGDHHNIEAKLKSLFLSAFIELNKINFDKEPGNVDELKRFNSVNRDVEQCVYILFKVLDMHATHDWSKGGITKALEGNFIEKYIREVALPTAIEKGIVLLNEIYQEFMGDPNKYQLVRRNIYRSMSEAFTDTSKPPP